MQDPCPGCQKKWSWHAGRGCGPCDVCEDKEEWKMQQALNSPAANVVSLAQYPVKNS